MIGSASIACPPLTLRRRPRGDVRARPLTCRHDGRRLTLLEFTGSHGLGWRGPWGSVTEPGHGLGRSLAAAASPTEVTRG